MQALVRQGPASLEPRSEEHTSELQSRLHLVCRLLLEKKNKQLRLTGIPFLTQLLDLGAQLLDELDQNLQKGIRSRLLQKTQNLASTVVVAVLDTWNQV